MKTELEIEADETAEKDMTEFLYKEEEDAEKYGEDLPFEEPDVAACLPPTDVQHSSDESHCSVVSETFSGSDSYRTKVKQAMAMKWRSLTGKRPMNVPITVSYHAKSEEEASSYFGNRRPLLIEKQRQENWIKLKAEKKMAATYRNVGRVIRQIQISGSYCGLRCLRFSRNGATLATSFGNGLVQIRRSDSGDVLTVLKTIEFPRTQEVQALRYHPQNPSLVYAGGASGTIQAFRINNPTAIARVHEHNNEICNMDLSPDGSIIVSVGKDSNVYIHDSHTLRLMSMQKKPQIDEFITSEVANAYHQMRIFGLRYHPTDSNVFVTGGWDQTVKVWDTRVCGAVRSIQGPRICGDSIDVRGNEILTGSWSACNGLKIWDLSSGRVQRSLSIMNRCSPLDGDFFCVAKFFTGSGYNNHVIVGGHGSDEVIIINIEKDMVIASYPAMKAVTALDNYGRVIAYGGMESLLRFGDLHLSHH